MNRIAPTALYQEVAERLRQRIFAHELTPGTWIDEQKLAEQYGISRTPLREALKVLASEDWSSCGRAAVATSPKFPARIWTTSFP
jgi:DNA-binding GntR family transcriptional regulator